MATKKNNSLEKRVEQKPERFEKIVDAKVDSFEKTFINWLRTSQIFDGMVNTPARILINSMTAIALYGWGFWVFLTESQIVAWTICLAVLAFMQAASVRFVFNVEGSADEYQSKRKAKAYRKAYSNIRLVAITIVLLGAFRASATGRSLWLHFGSYTFFDNYRALTGAVFLIALITFQKYFAYGMKGEPFTIRENNKIKD